MDIVKKPEGDKTYIAASGLLGLAPSYVTTGNDSDAAQSLMAAPAAAGLRNAITRSGAGTGGEAPLHARTS